MNKKYLFITPLILIVVLGTVYYQHYRTTHVSNHYELIDSLTIEYGSKVYPAHFIKSIQGKIIKEEKINTTKLGITEVEFSFINEYNKKVSSRFSIKIVDTTSPLIWVKDSYSINVNYPGNLIDNIMCADNYDRDIKCQITGSYDVNKVGKYPLNIKATDSSGNNTSIDFLLYVNEKETTPEEIMTIEFSDVITNYKNTITKIGIDVSKWQGDIDWNKVKAAGVEFVIIKIGGQDGINGDNYLDSHFKDNIEGALSVGLDVGLYYFSYAKTTNEATNQVNWIMNNIKDYSINLPISFDWEIWSQFNYLDINLVDLNLIAEAFLKEVTAKGYSPMLYSSKNRLERIWTISDCHIWLAHYTSETNYQGKYLLWQMTSNGHVDGIKDNYVDIDIMYLN